MSSRPDRTGETATEVDVNLPDGRRFGVMVMVSWRVWHDAHYGADADGNRGVPVDELHSEVKWPPDCVFDFELFDEVELSSLSADTLASLRKVVEAKLQNWEPDPDDYDERENDNVDKENDDRRDRAREQKEYICVYDSDPLRPVED
jgi:hypothetical protein